MLNHDNWEVNRCFLTADIDLEMYFVQSYQVYNVIHTNPVASLTVDFNFSSRSAYSRGTAAFGLSDIIQVGCQNSNYAPSE